MIPALYMLAALLVTGVVLRLLHRQQSPASTDDKSASETSAPSETAGDADGEECCGMHITCERDSLLAGVSPEIEYYDDEELDRWRGVKSDDYPPEGVEQFRDVLLTLLPDDIAGWARSVQLRGLEIPDAVREELLMIVSEERRKRQHA